MNYLSRCSDRVFLLIGMSIVLLYYLPYIILGENMFVNAHDFLDCHQANMKVLKDHSALFKIDYIFPSMDGLPISGFDSLYPLRCLIYSIFQPYTAFLVGDAIARVVAFIGMFLLLTYRKNKPELNNAQRIIALIVSILFGFLFFNDGYFELGSAGVPLMLYSFANLKDGKRKIVSLVLLVFIASFSSIFHLAFFSCILLLGYYLYKCYCDNSKYPWFFIGLLIFGLSSILFSYNIIYNFFVSDVVSHRTEFNLGMAPKEILFGCFRMLLNTQEHTGILPTSIIILVTIYYIFLKKGSIDRDVKFLLILIASILVYWCIYQYAKYILPDFKIIHTFQADRFYFWLPTLWLALFYYVLMELHKMGKNKKVMSVIVLLLFANILVVNPEFRPLIRKYVIGRHPVTYKQFYDVNLFNKIKSELNIRDDTKVVALGMYPSILSYNGLYTLDGYYVSYPLSYKKKFREVIKDELDKNKDDKEYFDNWGSRCYIFSSELNHSIEYGKFDEKRSIENLSINTEALGKMGCEYIISSVAINNYRDLNLSLVNIFTTPDSFWELFVYKVKTYRKSFGIS